MTIYFLGGEMGAFVPSDAAVYETADTATYDPSFARGSTFAPTNVNYGSLSLGASHTDLWLHYECITQLKVGTNSHQGTAIWYDSTGTARIGVNVEPTRQELSLWYYNGAWVQIGSTISVTIQALQTFDLHSVVNSATGSIDLYIAGTPRIQSGSLNLSSITNLQSVRLYGWGGPTNTATNYYSQVIVADETTVGWRLGTIPMTGNGASTTWNGTVADIDETVYSDADTINSTSNNEVELYTGTAVFNSTGYRIRAVGITARAKKSTSGPTQMALALRSAGTTYLSTTHSFASVGYEAHVAIWETNPATTAAFLSSELAALQFGVKSLSSTST